MIYIASVWAIMLSFLALAGGSYKLAAIIAFLGLVYTIIMPERSV